MVVREDTDAGGEALVRARAAWHRWWFHLRCVSPSQAVRALLSAVGLGITGWLAVASWPALLPFAVGGAVAYVVLPVVNCLDLFMPRWLAALLAMGGVVLLIAAIVRLMLPPLTEELSRLLLALPGFVAFVVDREQIDTLLRDVPEPVRGAIGRGIDNLVASVNVGINRRLDEPLGSLVGLSAWLLNSLGFVLGFLVIPTWFLIVLRDQRAAREALGRVVPARFAPDFWAVVRILDRAFGTYVRGQLLLGLSAGVASFGGLILLDLLYGQPGIQSSEYAIAVGVLAGLLYLIPVIGPLLGLLAAALIGWTFSGEVALLASVIILAAQQGVRRLVAPHVDRRVSDLHPAILAMAIAALSQFGVFWVFLAAPIVVIARDLFRYAYGRLGDPSLTANAALASIGAAPAVRATRASLVRRRRVGQGVQQS